MVAKIYVFFVTSKFFTVYFRLKAIATGIQKTQCLSLTGVDSHRVLNVKLLSSFK